jgi:DNA-binding XRE family transcriptional regulator
MYSFRVGKLALLGGVRVVESVTGRVALVHLQVWRAYRGYSQRELAKRAGVGLATINRLETGVTRANWKTVARLAEGLGIRREQLMHEEPR